MVRTVCRLRPPPPRPPPATTLANHRRATPARAYLILARTRTRAPPHPRPSPPTRPAKGSSCAYLHARTESCPRILPENPALARLSLSTRPRPTAPTAQPLLEPRPLERETSDVHMSRLLYIEEISFVIATRFVLATEYVNEYVDTPPSLYASSKFVRRQLTNLLHRASNFYYLTLKTPIVRPV
jgi:hypothetical protein